MDTLSKTLTCLTEQFRLEDFERWGGYVMVRVLPTLYSPLTLIFRVRKPSADPKPIALETHPLHIHDFHMTLRTTSRSLQALNRLSLLTVKQMYILWNIFPARPCLRQSEPSRN